jgi:hypothetical protein
VDVRAQKLPLLMIPMLNRYIPWARHFPLREIDGIDTPGDCYPHYSLYEMGRSRRKLEVPSQSVS